MKRRRLMTLLMAGFLVSAAFADKLVSSDQEDLKKKLSVAMGRVSKSAESERDGLEYGLVKGDTINAFVPSDNQNSILVFEGAVTGLPEAQLHFLLSHEFVHANRKHSSKQSGRGLLVGLAKVGLSIFTRNSTEEQRKSIDDFGTSMENLAHKQYGQEQEQEADREALRMLARAGYDPVNAILFFQSQSPANEEKDVLGTHPTFAARLDDVARHLPSVDYQPPEIANSKSLLVNKPEYIGKTAFGQAVVDQELSAGLFTFLQGGETGLSHDPVGSQTLQAQLTAPMKAEATPSYSLSVKQYKSSVSSTVIESDIIGEVAKALKSGTPYRSYSVAASRDTLGNRQVALLLLR